MIVIHSDVVCSTVSYLTCRCWDYFIRILSGIRYVSYFYYSGIICKCDTSLSIPSLMSFIRIRNRIGRSTVPCGTPLLTSDSFDFTPLAIMNCFLLDNKSWIHMPSLPLIPSALNLWQRMPKSTLSKALEKSR